MYVAVGPSCALQRLSLPLFLPRFRLCQQIVTLVRVAVGTWQCSSVICDAALPLVLRAETGHPLTPQSVTRVTTAETRA